VRRDESLTANYYRLYTTVQGHARYCHGSMNYKTGDRSMVFKSPALGECSSSNRTRTRTHKKSL